MARVTKYTKPLLLSVFMSNKYIYAQVVHSPTAYTLLSASTIEKQLRQSLSSTSDKQAAAEVGQLLGQRMKEKSIGAVAFEMKPWERYHGKLKALLDALTGTGVKLL